ncbi:hypothetical protein I317_04375 [Kwoniella heveanensis CBS 569]|nr:hypothetical protein I317_04375 [Kwoniella heveanensis CBS 569]
MGSLKKTIYHPTLSQPFISLGLTALTLLLLVLVLLSVPGPIKSLSWFTVKGEGEGSEGSLSAGVLGWCMTDTSNCTYAPLSDNAYLSTMIDTGEALVVRTMLPLACYWMIVTFILWIGLTILSPIGYIINDLDSISRHLKFAIVESCVLCMSIFGNVLCWLAFGLGRTAYLSVERAGGNPKSGRAMETTAVAALFSLISLVTAIWGLHLRLRGAQIQWKEEAVMVRRRSMALCASGAVGPDEAASLGGSLGGTGSIRVGGTNRDSKAFEKRWSTSTLGLGVGPGGAVAPEYSTNGLQHRGSLVKAGYHPEQPQPQAQTQAPPQDRDRNREERLDEADRSSQEMVRKISLHDGPYAAAHNAAPN